MNSELNEKICLKCNKNLSIELFTKDKNYYRNTCKLCKITQMKIRNEKNRKINENKKILLKDKECSSCNKRLPIINFYTSSTNKCGYRNSCIECEKKNRNKIITQKQILISKKICNTCNIEKSVNEFKKNNKSTDGFYHKCSSCWTPPTWNKEKQKESEKKYVKNNPEKIKEKYKKQGLKINRRIRNSLNIRIKDVLLSFSLRKDNTTLNYVGCSLDLLKKWFEFLFEDNMDFNNYGKWHIDHIKPCCSYDLSKDEDVKECFNWKNLRPCWAKENLEKSDKINYELIRKYKIKANEFLNKSLPNQPSNSVDGTK